MGCTLTAPRKRRKTLYIRNDNMDVIMGLAIALVLVVAYVGIRKPQEQPSVEMSPLLKVTQPDLPPKEDMSWMDLDDGETSDSESMCSQVQIIRSPLRL